MMQDYATLRVEQIQPHILLATLNRPDFANAMNTQMGRDLHACFDAISAAPAAQRCVVLTGAGAARVLRRWRPERAQRDDRSAVAGPASDLRAGDPRHHRLPGADHRRGQRRGIRRRAGDRARMRLHLCRRARPLRADRGDAGHHARRRRHANAAPRGGSAPGEGDHADRQAVLGAGGACVGHGEPDLHGRGADAARHWRLPRPSPPMRRSRRGR